MIQVNFLTEIYFLDSGGVIPLVRKHELEITPLNEFEEVTHAYSEEQTKHETSPDSLRSLGYHSHAYVGLPNPVFVKHSISLFPSESKSTITPPKWIPKAKLPSFVVDDQKERESEIEQSTTEIQIEEQAVTTQDPYLKDGDVITKIRHEGKTENGIPNEPAPLSMILLCFKNIRRC